MKRVKLFIYTLLMIVTLTSCGNKDKTNSVSQEDFVGKWKLISMELISSENNSKESQEVIDACEQFNKFRDNITIILYLNSDGSFEKKVSMIGVINKGKWKYLKGKKALVISSEFLFDGESLVQKKEENTSVLTSYKQVSNDEIKIVFMSETYGVTLETKYIKL